MNFDRATFSHHLTSMLTKMDKLDKKPFARRGELRHAFHGRTGKPVENLRTLMLDNLTDIYRYLVRDVEEFNFEITDTYMRLLKAKGETPSFKEARERLKKEVQALKTLSVPASAESDSEFKEAEENDSGSTPELKADTFKEISELSLTKLPKELQTAKVPPGLLVPEFYRLLSERNPLQRNQPAKKPSLQLIDRPSDRAQLRNKAITREEADKRQILVQSRRHEPHKNNVDLNVDPGFPRSSKRLRLIHNPESTKGADEALHAKIRKARNNILAADTYSDPGYKFLTEDEVTKLARDYYLVLRMMGSQQCRGSEMSVVRNSHAFRKAGFEYFKRQYLNLNKLPSAGIMSGVKNIRYQGRPDPMDEGREERQAIAKSRIEKRPGLYDVKEMYGDMLAVFLAQKARTKLKLKVEKQAHHLLLIGDPGVGKTEFATMMAEDMFERKALSKGHLVKINARDCIGPYLGQTEKQTKAILARALGGVLFIDEIYALANAEDQYAQAALALIVDFIEEHRDNIILVGAGYPKEMKVFLEANSGLASRFQVVELKPYTHSEMLEIFDYQMEEVYGFKIEDGVRDKLSRAILEEMNRGDPNYGNGRYIRKWIEAMEKKCARRLENEGFFAKQDSFSEEEQIRQLTTFTMADFLSVKPSSLRAEIKLELADKKKQGFIGFIEPKEILPQVRLA